MKKLFTLAFIIVTNIAWAQSSLLNSLIVLLILTFIDIDNLKYEYNIKALEINRNPFKRD